MRNSKATEVAAEVNKQFGHTVGVNQIYLIKTKANMRQQPRAVRRVAAMDRTGKLASAALWVDAIKIAKQLLGAERGVGHSTLDRLCAQLAMVRRRDDRAGWCKGCPDDHAPTAYKSEGFAPTTKMASLQSAVNKARHLTSPSST